MWGCMVWMWILICDLTNVLWPHSLHESRFLSFPCLTLLWRIRLALLCVSYSQSWHCKMSVFAIPCSPWIKVLCFFRKRLFEYFLSHSSQENSNLKYFGPTSEFLWNFSKTSQLSWPIFPSSLIFKNLAQGRGVAQNFQKKISTRIRWKTYFNPNQISPLFDLVFHIAAQKRWVRRYLYHLIDLQNYI